MPETVLICDDDAQMRRLIAVVLRGRGYDLREASHGQAALDEMAANPPALTILDLHMPGIDGLAVLERIRSDPALVETKVLLLTGAKEALDKDWGVRVGADGHLAKPFPVGDLEGAIQSLLAER